MHVAFALLVVGVVLPPICPWDRGDLQLLLPTTGRLPLNTSVWARTYGSRDLTLMVHTSTRPVEVETEVIITPLLSTPGNLIQLRPKAPLLPDRNYFVKSDLTMLGSFATAPETDTTPPAVPVVGPVEAHTVAFDRCDVPGVTFDLSDPAEPVLHLFERGGELLELSASFDPIMPHELLPTAANEAVTFEVVAMDLAGNRSQKADASGVAGAATIAPRSRDTVERGGCRCVARAPVSRGLSTSLALLMAACWLPILGRSRVKPM